MLWTQRLNSLGGEFDLGEAGRAQVLSWNYAPALLDNAPHRHTFFEVCSVGAHGDGEFRVENSPHSIGGGDSFFARPGALHQIVNTGDVLMELFWLSFSLDARSEMARQFAGNEVLVARDERVLAIWNALRLTTEPLVPGWDEVARALGVALLHAILGAGTASSVEIEPQTSDFRAHQARLAVRYIHDNLAKKLSLPEIAAHIHVSPRQLIRLFALFAGTTPAHYIELARLDRAESLLLRSAKPLKTVALEVGFEDVAHFSRVFARRCGNPPGDFRRRGGPLIERPSGANIQKTGDLV